MTDDTRPLVADVTFAVIPTWLLDADVSATAVRLYGVLRRYADQTGAAWPSRATLAARVQCSIDTVDRALRALVGAGAITIVHRRAPSGALTSSLYRLHAQPVGRPVDNRPDLAALMRPPSRTGAATLAAPVRQELEPLNERTPNPAAAGSCPAHPDGPGRSCRACGTSPRALRAAERTRRDPWCGECDERTRLRDYDTLLPSRCPNCHPLR